MKPINYASHGIQARAQITFLQPFNIGDWVQITIYRYIFGTHFTGVGPTEMASSLTNAINGIGRNLCSVPNRNYTFHGLFYAVQIGTMLEVIATTPGQGSNIYAITTNVATKITVPTYFTGGYDAPVAQLTVAAPIIIDGVGGVATDAFNGPAQTIKELYIQNLGIVPIKYAINTTASATVFHGIIGPGTVVDDGFGMVASILHAQNITRVSLYADYSYRASVVKFS